MRKRKHFQDRVNHDRWLISYADFITLLFAFFVVMYSVSTINENKYRAMSASVIGAFGNTPPDNNPSSNLSKPAPSAEVKKPDDVKPTSKEDAVKKEQMLAQEKGKMKELAHGIFNALAPLIREGKVQVTQTDRGISIDISDSVLFDSGDAQLKPKSSQALIAIASVLTGDTHDIQVEGFTDNQPIKNGIYPSNWELSSVRAGAVVRLFIEHGVAEDRLTAIGQGPKMPVGDNATLEGRAKNRRVNITILAMLPEKKEEVSIEGESASEGANGSAQ